ncbi:hypothetical protein ACTG9Q_15850 [Actinokineospora sp. 24-640]
MIRKTHAILLGLATAAALFPSAASATTAAPNAGCGVTASAPSLVRTGGQTFLTGFGTSLCSGTIRLMEERRFWADHVIASAPVDLSELTQSIAHLCRGGDLGNVYVQVEAGGKKANSTYVRFDRCA